MRVLAPLVNDKFCDPAVVVIDERAQHVISLLSGHAGGANALARYLAGMLGADPVITTATDVNDMAALDTLAFQLNARMSDFRSAVKIVNQMLVSNKRVGLWWDDELTQDVSHCDRRGFITVTDLNQLPELDALVCITYAPIYLTCLFRTGSWCHSGLWPELAVAVIRRSLCWLRCLPGNLKLNSSIRWR